MRPGALSKSFPRRTDPGHLCNRPMGFLRLALPNPPRTTQHGPGKRILKGFACMENNRKPFFPEEHGRPFIVPVFIPQSGCPHRCAFCNQQAITAATADLRTESVKTAIDRFLAYRRGEDRVTEISFYGGNFLGQNPETIQRLLETASGYVRSGQANGIRFSTRPDTVDAHRMAIISRYPVKTVELGAQSMDDYVLTLSKRGHSARDTVFAADLLKRSGYETGLQMMVGLPGDNDDAAMRTGRRIASLSPAFVRIYPALVIRGSRLEKWYRAGKYSPIPLEHCIRLLKSLCLLFSGNNIPVAKIGLQATDGLDSGKDLVAGPYHPALGQMVASEIFLDRAAARIKASREGFSAGLNLVVNPRMISTMRGQKNTNIARLEKMFPNAAPIGVIGDPEAGKNDVKTADAGERN